MSNTFTFLNAGFDLDLPQCVVDGNHPLKTQLRFGLS